MNKVQLIIFMVSLMLSAIGVLHADALIYINQPKDGNIYTFERDYNIEPKDEDGNPTPVYPLFIDVTSPTSGPLDVTVNLLGDGPVLAQNLDVTSFNLSSVITANGTNNTPGTKLTVNGDVSTVLRSGIDYAYRTVIVSHVDSFSTLVHNGNLNIDVDFHNSNRFASIGVVAYDDCINTLNGNLTIDQLKITSNNDTSAQAFGAYASSYSIWDPHDFSGGAVVNLGKEDGTSTISINNINVISTVAPSGRVKLSSYGIFAEGNRGEVNNLEEGEAFSIVNVRGELFINNITGWAEKGEINVAGISGVYGSNIYLREKAFINNISGDAGRAFGKASAFGVMIFEHSNIIASKDVSVSGVNAVGDYEHSGNAKGLNAYNNSNIIINGNLSIEDITAVNKSNAHSLGIELANGSALTVDGDTYISGIDSNSTSSYALAAGIMLTEAIADLKGNVYIKNISSNTGDNFALLLQEDSELDINADADLAKEIQIEGNINAFDRGTLNINFTNEKSFLRGLLIEEYYDDLGNITMSLTNNAVWAPTGNDYFLNTASNLTIDNGVIDMSWWYDKRVKDMIADGTIIADEIPMAYRTMGLEKATINSGFIYLINTDVNGDTADLFTLGELLSDDNEIRATVKIAYDPVIDKIIAGEEGVIPDTFRIPVFIIENTNGIAVAGSGAAYTYETPLKKYQINSEAEADTNVNETTIYLTALTITEMEDPSELVKTDDDTIILLKWLFRSRLSTDNLLRRLGDLRIDQNHNKDGIWVRLYAAEQEFDSNFENRNISHNYYGGQLGLDKKYIGENSTRYFGGFIDLLHANNTYANGNGITENIGFGLYNTWIMDDGSYIDLVGKIGRIAGNYNIKNLNDETVKGKYDTWDMVLSAEYGYRIEANANWIIEPEVQLTYGRIADMSYTTDNDVTFKSNNLESMIGRAGFIAGRNFDKGNLYFGGDFLYDFAGGTTIFGYYGEDISEEYITLDKYWYKIKVGTDINISTDDTFYCEMSTLLGKSINKNWLFDFGFRFGF